MPHKDVLVVLKELRGAYQEIAQLQPDLTMTFETRAGADEVIWFGVVSKRDRCIESRFEALALRTSQWLEVMGLPSCQPALTRWRQHPLVFYAAVIDVIPAHPACFVRSPDIERAVIYGAEHAAVTFIEILITEAEAMSGRLPADLVTQARAAVIAEVDRTTLRRWTVKGKLPVYGPAKQVSESELQALLPSLRERWPRSKPGKASGVTRALSGHKRA